MSVENLEKVIRQAVVDVEFRGALFAAPEKALEGFDLTDGERSLFMNLPLDEEGLGQALSEADSGELEERISRGDPWN